MLLERRRRSSKAETIDVSTLKLVEFSGPKGCLMYFTAFVPQGQFPYFWF
jgi:hypothetical protein